MPKPTEKPTWASQTSTTATGGQPPRRVAPDGPDWGYLRNIGWSYQQKPPAEIMNWWMHNVSEWVDYVDGLRAADIATQSSGSVQQALDNLQSTNNSQQTAINALVTAVTAMPAPDSIGLRELKKPAATVQGPDAWSSITGSIAAGGSVWPAPMGSEVWGANGQQDIDWWNVQERTLDGLEVRNTTRINNGYSTVILRIHGDLILRAPLKFLAAQDAQAASINAGNPWSDLETTRTGGGGVWGESFDQKRRPYEPQPFPRAHAWLNSLNAARSIPAIYGILPWLRGGGAAGGKGFYSRKIGFNLIQSKGNRSAMGGGNALVMVSGDIVIEGQGAIRCDASPGVTTPFVQWLDDDDIESAAGGGGGGALFVFCGGRVRAVGGAVPAGVFSANGGAGAALPPGTGMPTWAGNGGGGGYASLCARNAEWSWLSASAGAGGAINSVGQYAGIAGSSGATRFTKAIPQLLY